VQKAAKVVYDVKYLSLDQGSGSGSGSGWLVFRYLICGCVPRSCPADMVALEVAGPEEGKKEEGSSWGKRGGIGLGCGG
jgi:hypothetical protein